MSLTNNSDNTDNNIDNSDDIYISFNQTEKYACFGTAIGFYIYSLCTNLWCINSSTFKLNCKFNLGNFFRC